MGPVGDDIIDRHAGMESRTRDRREDKRDDEHREHCEVHDREDAVQRNAHLVLANNELAGAARASGKLDDADRYEKQADQFTPSNPLYHWVLGRRLQDLGMTELAEKHLRQANQPDGATPNDH